MSANVEIRKTGVQILSERGLDAVTVSEVARRSGYSRQTVHVNFKNVETLRTEIAKDARAEGNTRAIQWLDMVGK